MTAFLYGSAYFVRSRNNQVSTSENDQKVRSTQRRTQSVAKEKHWRVEEREVRSSVQMQPVRDSASREANGKRPEFVVGSSYFYRHLFYEIFQNSVFYFEFPKILFWLSPQLAFYSRLSSSAGRVKRVLWATFEHFGKQGIRGLSVKKYSLFEGEARVRVF